MSAYPHLTRLGKWLLSSFLPFVIVAVVAHYTGYQDGHEAGRTEMKCAIFAVIERLGDTEPVPDTISLGCDKVPPRTTPARASERAA